MFFLARCLVWRLTSQASAQGGSCLYKCFAAGDELRIPIERPAQEKLPTIAVSQPEGQTIAKNGSHDSSTKQGPRVHMSASREGTNPNNKCRAGNDRAWVFFTKEEHRPEGQSAEHNGASVSSRWDPSNRHQEFKPTKMEGGQNKNMRQLLAYLNARYAPSVATSRGTLSNCNDA
jgi:hypothetical protein